MSDALCKRAVLAALSYAPDFSDLHVFPGLDRRSGQDLLRWLDWSGLALGFLRQLQNQNATKQIPEEWRDALEQRQARNLERTRDMLEEARRINAAFLGYGVTAASLKGLTLVPDFCEDLAVRHQVDLDFLVAPVDVCVAAYALRSCGYAAAHLSESGETCFRTPSQHIPSPNDDLYLPQRQRQVDLHISIWEPCPWLPVETPADCLEHTRRQTAYGVEHFALSLEDKFLLQVLHLFRHSFRSWIRLSWLLEIAKCMEKHRGDADLWKRVILRAGPTRLTRSIFAFVLGLVARLFHTPIPLPLRMWTAEATTVSVEAWLENFACDWAIADWPGSLNNLFLTREFIPDPILRRQYWQSRLFPKRQHASLGAVEITTPKNFFRLQAARLGYVANRATAHAKDLASLPWQQLRWKRVLESSRRFSVDTNC